MSTYESMEMLGTASDELDHLIGAMELPMPPQFHVDQLKTLLPKIRDRMREIYRLETGDDPWGI